MIYGLIAAFVVLLGITGMNLAIYMRHQSKMDAAKHEEMKWGIRIEGAIGTAEAAKRAVDTIELEHYKKLLVKHESQALELSEAKREIDSLRKEVETLRNTVASFRREVKKVEKEGPNLGAPSQAGGATSTMEELIANGHALPPEMLVPNQPQKRPRTFGQIP